MKPTEITLYDNTHIHRYIFAKSFFMTAIYMTYRKRRISRRRKNGSKSSRRKRSLRGGCGCDNNKSIFSGGSNQLGPSPGLDQLPIRSYYDLNTYGGDPNNPSEITSVRTQPNMTGGRSRRRRKSKSKSYRRRGGNAGGVIKGGGLFDSWSLLGNDSVSTFGTLPGAFNSNELLRGNFGANSNASVQPVAQMFNPNNLPLV
jgi:hypothetical protein